ncbi:hypothetical protein NSQ26_14140 [Bacillus sp. FSL W7-1360]
MYKTQIADKKSALSDMRSARDDLIEQKERLQKAAQNLVLKKGTLDENVALVHSPSLSTSSWAGKTNDRNESLRNSAESKYEIGGDQRYQDAREAIDEAYKRINSYIEMNSDTILRMSNELENLKTKQKDWKAKQDAD